MSDGEYLYNACFTCGHVETCPPYDDRVARCESCGSTDVDTFDDPDDAHDALEDQALARESEGRPRFPAD